MPAKLKPWAPTPATQRQEKRAEANRPAVPHPLRQPPRHSEMWNHRRQSWAEREHTDWSGEGEGVKPLEDVGLCEQSVFAATCTDPFVRVF
jgi:hypothetical protein